MTQAPHTLSDRLVELFFNRFSDKNINEIRNFYRIITGATARIRPAIYRKAHQSLKFVSESYFKRLDGDNALDLSSQECAKEIYIRNYSNIMADLSFSTTHSLQQIVDIVSPLDQETIDCMDEIRHQKGSIGLSIHSGCAELGMGSIIGHGIPVGNFYKPQKSQAIEKFIQHNRFGGELPKRGSLLLPADDKSPLAVSRYAKKKGSIAIFSIDSIPRTTNAMNVKLFGKNWSIPMLGIKLALKYNKSVYFITQYWNSTGGNFKLKKIADESTVNLDDLIFSCQAEFISFLKTHWADYYWKGYPLKSLNYVNSHIPQSEN